MKNLNPNNKLFLLGLFLFGGCNLFLKSTEESQFCSDGVDNDGDNLIDCFDSECVINLFCTVEQICDDATDNDADGRVDCNDRDCRDAPNCIEVICNDNIDNDNDNDTDCEDNNCEDDPNCIEAICNDNLDNDDDEDIDCNDSDCALDPACVPPEICNDTIDNDSDTFTDCDDTDCSLEINCLPSEFCVDGLDNDGDGAFDCDDPDCNTTTVCSSPQNCNDGLPTSDVSCFLPNQRKQVSARPFMLTAADINSDTNIDIVVANRGDGSAQNPSSVTILRNNNVGSFIAEASIPFGVSAMSVDVASVGGDSAPEILAVDFVDSVLGIFQSDGFGNFSTQFSAFPTEQSPRSIAVANLDGDAFPDIAMTCDIGLVNVFYGESSPFAFTTSDFFLVGSAPSGLVKLDVNNDGFLDLITANQGSNSISILKNDQDRTFTEIPIPAGNGPDFVALGDFSSDGIADVVVPNLFGNDVSIFITGNQTLTENPARFPCGNAPRSLAVADLDQDGDLDIVTANEGASPSLSVLLQTNRNPLQFSQAVIPITGKPQGVVVADFNKDTFPDIAVADEADGEVEIFFAAP